MPSDLYPKSSRGKSKIPLSGSDDPPAIASIQQPLLGGSAGNSQSTVQTSPQHSPLLSRRSTFSYHGTSRDRALVAAREIRIRYAFATIFLITTLAGYCLQSELASYLQGPLKWDKPFCMMYVTHSSWIVFWPVTVLVLWVQKRYRKEGSNAAGGSSITWQTFWKKHREFIRQTTQMVRYQNLRLEPWQQDISPWGHLVRTTMWLTVLLSMASASWFVAVGMSPLSDLTAIFNSSAFSAYVFSVLLLGEKVVFSKAVAVVVAVIGVFVISYGGGGKDESAAVPGEKHRIAGNLLMGLGSVVYGFYEAMYKKAACPSNDASSGRSVIFALTFGSLMGAFTLVVFWILLVFLHMTGWETFQWPQGEQAHMLFLCALSGAVFCGSFLVLVSLTSPVLSAVAAMLTIFIIALVEQALPPPLNHPLTIAAILGGLLILVAFFMLAWATYTEMAEEKKQGLSISGGLTDGEIASDEEDA